jgi:uncharacterized Rmd1/YagE family protein
MLELNFREIGQRTQLLRQYTALIVDFCTILYDEGGKVEGEKEMRNA